MLVRVGLGCQLDGIWDQLRGMSQGVSVKVLSGSITRGGTILPQSGQYLPGAQL